jgi:nucleoside-diphosphate-sugar epimerase
MKPVSWYGQSKKEAEEAAHSSGLPVTIVRPSAVYGEREKDISQVFPVPGFARRFSAALVGCSSSCLTASAIPDLSSYNKSLTF